MLRCKPVAREEDRRSEVKDACFEKTIGRRRRKRRRLGRIRDRRARHASAAEKPPSEARTAPASRRRHRREEKRVFHDLGEEERSELQNEVGHADAGSGQALPRASRQQMREEERPERTHAPKQKVSHAHGPPVRNRERAGPQRGDDPELQMSPEQRLNQLLPVAPPREEKHQRKRPHEVGEEEDEHREVKGEPSEALSEDQRRVSVRASEGEDVQPQAKAGVFSLEPPPRQRD